MCCLKESIVLFKILYDFNLCALSTDSTDFLQLNTEVTRIKLVGKCYQKFMENNKECSCLSTHLGKVTPENLITFAVVFYFPQSCMSGLKLVLNRDREKKVVIVCQSVSGRTLCEHIVDSRSVFGLVAGIHWQPYYRVSWC